MKKKILLAVLMVAMLVCLFAISISASDLAYDRVYTIDGTEYPLWEQDAEGNYHPLMWYQDGDKLSKVYADNTDSTKAPYVAYSAYTSGTSREIQNFNITDANGNTFNGKTTVVIANLHNIYLKAGDMGQITHIHKNAFKGSTILKAVYIPESIVSMGWTNNDNLVPFADCKALEYVEIAPSATIDEIKCNTFLNCTALKAISLPNSIKTINHSTFSNCTSLEAVYLPSSLETFVHNSWDKDAFYNCSKLYFVNEPFTVDDIATDMPAKPDVYYFPANLSAIGDAFRGCASINNTLVFGDKLLVVENTVFTGTGAKGDVKTAVFTGNLTKFYFADGFDPTWNFVFTNVTNESVFSTRTDRAYGGSYGYLCKTNRKVKFNYGVAWEDGTTHFVDVRKSEIVNATCLTNEIATTYCFCGSAMGTSEVENSALGHEFNLEKGATKDSIEYANYLAKGTLNIKCARCEECDGSDVAPIISSFKGYSTKIEGEGLTFGYTIDYEALEEYVKVSGKSVELGFVVAAKSPLGENAPLNENGEAAGEKVIKATVVTWTTDDEANASVAKYTGADFKITGDWSNNMDSKIYMAGYIIDGTGYAYLNVNGSSNTADYTTYNTVLNSENEAEAA